MHCYILLVLSSLAVSITAWSVPQLPQPGPPSRRPHAPNGMRFTRFAALPDYHLQQHRAPIPGEVVPSHAQAPRAKRDPRPRHDDDDDDHIHNYGIDHGDGYGPSSHHHGHRDHHDHDHKGTTGPVHTFIKTDKNANYKWGVRHHVGNKFAS